MNQYKSSMIILVIILALSPQFTSGDADPVIDGINSGEWEDANKYKIEMTNGEIIDMRIIYTSTDIFFFFDMSHDGPNDKIILDTDQEHDYFGIEFDINNDGAIMGTPDSPDDLIMVDYNKPGVLDMYMHNFKAFEDVKNGGVDNGDAASGSKNGHIIWEFRKPLNSGDQNGYDIALNEGDEYYIMLAYWDDKAPYTAAVYTNTFSDSAQFMRFVVGEINPVIIPNLIGVLVLISSGMITIFLYNKRIE